MPVLRLEQWLHWCRGWCPGWWVSEPREPGLGKRGEQAAEEFLRQLGYRIVARSYRTAWGELDLIAVDDQTIVYVEVKTLRRPSGKPERAVGFKKRRQLIKLAQSFAASRGLRHQKSRFDVVAVTWPDADQAPAIRHYKHAFRGPDQGVGGYHREH